MLSRLEQKSKLTETVLELIPADQRPTLETALKLWYRNIRTTGGYRLTEKGYQQFCQLDFENWTFDLKQNDEIFTKRLLIELDKKLELPYYINTKQRQVLFFSSKEAMTAALYGSLQKFITMK